LSNQRRDRNQHLSRSQRHSRRRVTGRLDGRFGPDVLRSRRPRPDPVDGLAVRR